MSERSRKHLYSAGPPEWADVGRLLEESEGDDTPDKRLERVNLWIRGLRGRRGKEVSGPMLAALKRACENDPGDEPESEGPRPFSLGLIDSAAFFSQEYRLDWLVKGLMIKNDPSVIGGPSKALKTSILIDKAISLATATPFLNRFDVPVARRVALISGESGRRVIQSSARQVCVSRGLSERQALGNILWGFDLPQLTSAEHLAVLRKTIADNGIEYLAVDPFYLTLMAGGAGIDPRSMFEMGPLLADVARLCIDEGCTVELAHHFTKKREDPFGTPELAELAYSGIGQFVRQWMLVAPRERFDAEIGLFKLHLAYGGSAGHCGEFAVDIEVGKLDPDMDRRCWRVTVNTPSEVRNIAQEQRQAEAARKRAEKEQARAIDKNAEENREQAEAIDFFRKAEGRKTTARALRGALRWRHDKAARILYLLSEAGRIRPCRISISVGNGGVRECDGFELVGDRDGQL